MDESLSWQATLARHNINILNIDEDWGRWFYEFMYHPYAGSTKWCKTYIDVNQEASPAEVASDLLKEVAKLRRDLER